MPALVTIFQSYALGIPQVVHIINVPAIFINFRKEIFAKMFVFLQTILQKCVNEIFRFSPNGN
jgi:hypothetical protein